MCKSNIYEGCFSYLIITDFYFLLHYVLFFDSNYWHRCNDKFTCSTFGEELGWKKFDSLFSQRNEESHWTVFEAVPNLED